MPEAGFENLLEALKKCAAVLNEAAIPFLLGGGLASWARGGPPTEHDVDLMVRPDDAEAAWKALGESGLRLADPPEQWLLKAFDGDAMVDIIFEPAGSPVDDAMFGRSDELAVHAMVMRVIAAEDILVTKLLSLTEHHLDYDSVLEVARALREQIDWDSVRTRTESSPYARAFMVLVDALGLAA